VRGFRKLNQLQRDIRVGKQRRAGLMLIAVLVLIGLMVWGVASAQTPDIPTEWGRDFYMSMTLLLAAIAGVYSFAKWVATHISVAEKQTADAINLLVQQAELSRAEHAGLQKQIESLRSALELDRRERR